MNSNEEAPQRTRIEEFSGHEIRKVIAIVRTSVLERVEQKLEAFHIPGITVTKVKGFGEYTNFFSSDWMVVHARIEIILRRERADEVARAIQTAAKTGLPGDGVVFVIPVESVYRIRSGEVATSGEFGTGR